MVITPSTVDALRTQTPGCQHVLHFNNAGCSLPPLPVVEAMKRHIDLEASIGGYEAADAALKETEGFYKNAAHLINCDPGEIAFTDNATHAWDMAFYSLDFQPGDRILTGRSEYVSNYLAFLQMSKRKGVVIDVIRDDTDGQLDMEDLERKATGAVKLIAITHVPTQGGLINPATEVGRIAREKGILYLLDATQSVGQMPINVKEIECDFLCATGRKYLRGPRGTGFLYASQSKIHLCNPPFIDLQAATWIEDNDYALQPNAQRFETWEQNIAAKIGLKTAIDYALDLGVLPAWERIQSLSSRLRKQLEHVKSVTLQDMGKHQCGIVTFTHDRLSPQVIQKGLARQHMNVSVSLQGYARLDLRARNLPAVVRASVHYYNTEEEVDRFCEAIQGLGNLN